MWSQLSLLEKIWGSKDYVYSFNFSLIYLDIIQVWRDTHIPALLFIISKVFFILNISNYNLPILLFSAILFFIPKHFVKLIFRYRMKAANNATKKWESIFSVTDAEVKICLKQNHFHHYHRHRLYYSLLSLFYILVLPKLCWLEKALPGKYFCVLRLEFFTFRFVSFSFVITFFLCSC